MMFRMDWKSLVTVTFASTALVVIEYLRRQEKKQRVRKNELALQLMCLRNAQMHDDESVAYGRAMKPRKGDVFISTYPKCGTTWTCQIVHCLRSRGDMNFGELTEVVPWDILAKQCGQDLSAEQQWSPRVFKSHETWEFIPKNGDEAKYIYVSRHPLDAFRSFYHFLPDYAGLEENDLTMEQFKNAIFSNVSQTGQIWHHFVSWWNVRKQDNVLWLTFEELKQDLKKAIIKIAKFIEVDLDDELLRIVLHKSGFEFMSSEENHFHFDDHFVRNECKKRMGLSEDSKIKVGKVRKDGGKVGGRVAIPKSVTKVLEERWDSIVLPATGCKNYEEMRKKIREES
eukprot:g1963.t1